MKITELLVSASVALALLMPISVQAFECPKHFKAAQAAIDKATTAVKKLSGQPKAEVHMVLDDAKMFLVGAKHNHEKPQGKMDHARAIAKADAARGQAEAALILAGKY